MVVSIDGCQPENDIFDDFSFAFWYVVFYSLLTPSVPVA